MRKFISGFIAGAIIVGSIGVYAATYVAETATFKVMVNGAEFKSEPAALVVEGKTYLPLRAMGEALGVPVKWNEELRQAEVGATSSQVDTTKYSRSNPAPLNTIQKYEKKQAYAITPNYSANIRVIETIRGEEAWESIEKANMFNEAPKDGYEYIIVRVAFSLLTADNDASVSANYYDFDFYSGKDEEYEMVSVVYENKLSTNLFVGGSAEGYVIGMVKKDDANPKLAYGLDYYGANGIWFKLN